MGNSQQVVRKHYLQVTDGNCAKAAGGARSIFVNSRALQMKKTTHPKPQKQARFRNASHHLWAGWTNHPKIRAEISRTTPATLFTDSFTQFLRVSQQDFSRNPEKPSSEIRSSFAIREQQRVLASDGLRNTGPRFLCIRFRTPFLH